MRVETSPGYDSANGRGCDGSMDRSTPRLEVVIPLNTLSVLIVDDEMNIRKTLSVCLESRGHSVSAVSNARDALAEAERQVIDLAFVDIRLGTENGLDLIPKLSAACPWIKIVVITAYATIETAVEAMRRGAADYIPKPFTPDQVELVTERVSALRNMEHRVAALEEDLSRLHPDVTFDSTHPGTQRAVDLARQAAASEAVILLRGQSGTGKSALAKAIHRWSPRADRPLAVVSCPALSPELLESEMFGHVKGAFTGALRDNPGRVAACEGGTLFLDEIGDLPLSIQPKLLRFVQDREYERVGDQQTRCANVRLITATNADLESAVKSGRFREDLYYRLNVIQIEIPPLSQRPDDVEVLARSLREFFSHQNHKVLTGFTDDAMHALRSYGWPGNIRELRNVVERAVILCTADRIGTEHLPESICPVKHPLQVGDAATIREVEEAHIRRVLASSSSLQHAADLLGIDQATLWRKRKQYGI